VLKLAVWFRETRPTPKSFHLICHLRFHDEHQPQQETLGVGGGQY
jgi:hypothetical protein